VGEDSQSILSFLSGDAREDAASGGSVSTLDPVSPAQILGSPFAVEDSDGGGNVHVMRTSVGDCLADESGTSSLRQETVQAGGAAGVDWEDGHLQVKQALLSDIQHGGQCLETRRQQCCPQKYVPARWL